MESQQRFGVPFLRRILVGIPSKAVRTLKCYTKVVTEVANEI